MENDSDCDSIQTDEAGREKMDIFLEKCCEKVKDVDLSAAWLISSIDLFYSRTEKLVQQVDVASVNAELPKEVIQIKQECKEIFLLFEDTVLEAKVKTVESLRSFLHFMKQNVKSRSVSSCNLLSNTKYSDVRNKHKEKYIHRLLNENNEMKNEISGLNERIRLSDEKERTFIAERNSQKEKNKLLESDASQYESERDKAVNEIELLKKQHETSQRELNEEIESLTEELSAEVDKCRKTVKQSDELIDKLQTLQGEHKDMARVYEEKKMSLEAKIKSVERETEELGKVKKQLEADLESSRQEIKQKGEELREVKINSEKYKEEFKKAKAEFENEIAEFKTKYNKLIHEFERTENEMNIINLQNESLTKEVKEGEEIIREKDEEIECLQKSVKDLEMSEILSKQQYENEKTSLNEANDELVKKIDSMQSQLTENENEKRSLKDEVREIQSDLNRQIKEKDENNEMLRTCKVVLEEELETSQNRLESCRNNYEELSGEFEEEKKNSQRLSDLLNEKEQANARMEQEKQLLVRQRDEYEELIRKTNQEKENLQTQLTKVNTDIEFLQRRMRKDKDTYDKEINQRDNRIKELDRKLKWLYEEKENISKVSASIEKELERIKSKRIMQVQLYSQNRTSLTGSVEQGLITLLRERLESEKLGLDFVQCAKTSDIQPDIPVLLLCITVSRLGTDVTNAVQGLTLSPKMAVLIFHHKDLHALPNQDSGRILTGHGLKNVGGVFDVAFLSGKGIYECDMNKNNIISLINFINREGVRKTMHET